MKKIDKTVKVETIYMATVTVILSLFLQSIFLILSKWDYTVLLGNLYGGAVAVFNFFLLGLTVQSAVENPAEEAKKFIKTSQSLRLLMLFVFALIAYFIPFLNTISAIIPYLFPRIAIAFRPLIKKD